MTKLASSKYAVSAHLVPGPDGYAALLTAVSSLVAEEQGGFNLHAAAVALHGRAYLFIGPSGAGKTTAARMVRGARALADDRAMIVPIEGRWWAWGLPRGTPLGLPESDRSAVPLAGILRVEQGVRRCRLTSSGPLTGLFLLRQAVESGDLERVAEQARLTALMGCVDVLPVARLQTVLGADLRPLLDRWQAGDAASSEAIVSTSRVGFS